MSPNGGRKPAFLETDIFNGDRRSHVRVCVGLPGRVAWVPSRPAPQECMVVNISRAGALIILRKACGHWLPALGIHIHLEIDLPVARGFAARCLHCDGTVVRVSKSLAKPGEIGVKLSRMEFRDAKGACVRTISTRRLLEAFKMRPPNERES